ncbi:hypothetical protein DPEC_G00379120, partial [Dallia pectoralis]
ASLSISGLQQCCSPPALHRLQGLLNGGLPKAQLPSWALDLTQTPGLKGRAAVPPNVRSPRRVPTAYVPSSGVHPPLRLHPIQIPILPLHSHPDARAV